MLLPILICLLTSVQAEHFNIHIRLPQEVAKSAIDFNAAMNNIKPGSLDLNTTHEPHITLFLADFTVNESVVVSSVGKVVDSWRERDLGSISLIGKQSGATGTYAMWDFSNSYADSRVRLLADEIVIQLANDGLIKGTDTIPQWVLDLKDEEQRRRKIENIKAYGSPNVFSEFEPHVTLNCYHTADDTISAFQQAAQQGKQPAEVTEKGIEIAIGRVGTCGSVLRGKNVATWTLTGQKPRKTSLGLQIGCGVCAGVAIVSLAALTIICIRKRHEQGLLSADK